MWLFMRISGVLLLPLAFGHLAIMHLVSGGVDRINFAFVSARWTGVFWRSYDWLLLALAMLHSVIGARGVIQDHVTNKGRRAALDVLLYTGSMAFFLLGTFVIVTFAPSQMPGG